MPFQVFRRHQRKLLAFMAIFAMVAFSLDFSLLRSMGPGHDDPFVVQLYGKKVHRSDILAMQSQRARANRFMSYLFPSRPQFANFFGLLDTRAIVDALILQHEADRIHLPADRDFASTWLRKLPVDPPLTTSRFVNIYQQHFANEVTDGELLEEIANQIRILHVSQLPGGSTVTPYDLFQTYRDQNERVSAFAVAFPVSEYVAKVPDPTPAQVQAFFDQYKNDLPDKDSDKPGFKVPRKIQVEYVSADPRERARKIEDELTDKELRDAFAARPTEFPVPPPELPASLFADDPQNKLTPSTRDPFLEVRDQVARTVASERAREEVDRLLGRIQDDAMRPFANEYGRVLDDNKEAQDRGEKPQPLPQPGDQVAQLAGELGLAHEKTPPLDKTTAATYGQIGAAHRGSDTMEASVSFADDFFDSHKLLFEEEELTDPFGRRFLAWKTAEAPERVPTLDEVRNQVVQAWKIAEARPQAKKAAVEFAKQVEAAGFDMPKAAGSRTIITTTPVTKMTSGMQLNPLMGPEPARPSEIPQIPDAGPDFRKAYFDLQAKKVEIAPDQPQKTFYVLTLNERTPVDMTGLFGPYGTRNPVEYEVRNDTDHERIQAWREHLRAEAGLAPDWSPADEKKSDDQRRG